MTISLTSVLFLPLLITIVVEKAFLDSSAWDRPRVLDDLPAFLERFTPDKDAKARLSSSSKQKGSPHTVSGLFRSLKTS